MTPEQFWTLIGVLATATYIIERRLRLVALELYRVRLQLLQNAGEIDRKEANELARDYE